jgi:hypothetical protein
LLVVTRPVVAGEQPRLYRRPLASIAREADAASHSFLESFHALHDVIGIYDQQLALLLCGVAHMKQGFLMTCCSTRMRFELLPNPESVFAIGYSAPTDWLMTADLEDSYRTAGAIAERLGPHRDILHRDIRWEWPEDVLLCLVQDNLVEERIPDNGTTQLAVLSNMVSRFLPHLTGAREALARFIRENFSVEDLLYVSGASRRP